MRDEITSALVDWARMCANAENPTDILIERRGLIVTARGAGRTGRGYSWSVAIPYRDLMGNPSMPIGPAIDRCNRAVTDAIRKGEHGR